MGAGSPLSLSLYVTEASRLVCPWPAPRHLPSGFSESRRDNCGAWGSHSAQIQNNSGLPQGPADPTAGRLDHAANRLSRGSRWPVYDGGGTWGGSRMLGLRRRDFVTLLGGAGLLCAAKARRARAQQRALPVIGFMRSTSLAPFESLATAFRQGLNEAGFVEGRNVAVE